MNPPWLPPLPADLPALRLVRSPQALRLLARVISGLLVLTTFSLIFVPWQQTSMGTGRVVAHGALDRQQNIEAPIDGRIVRWWVSEGSKVKTGDPIVELSDIDPEIMLRLDRERDAVLSRLEAARARAKAIEARMKALSESRSSAVEAATSRVAMAKDRVRAAENAVEAAAAAEVAASLNLERQTSLAKEGLASTRAVEVAQLEQARAATDLQRARAGLEAARSELKAVESDRRKVANDADAGLDEARATHAIALAEEAAATGELTRLESRLARQASQYVTAPREGTILRLSAFEGAAMVRAGTPLAVLVPEGGQPAVELWVSGNDVPLMSEGRKVRLQFEGWPAIQFSGWPSVAVGTFGGRIALVDAADDGAGKFRVLVVPDGDEPWPAARFLRQGVRAHGWVLLDSVSLGFELWRQFNGFPPSFPAESMSIGVERRK